jgi:hypothetical protein
MGALVARVGVGVVGRMIADAGWAFVIIVALYVIHSVVRAVVLWVALGVHAVPFGDVLRIRFAGEAVEALTYTGPLLAEPAKGMLLTRRGVPPINAFAAIALEFLLYSATSAVFGAIAAFLLLTHGPLPPGLHGAAVALLIAMVVFVIATIVAGATGIGLIAPSLRAVNAMIRHHRVAAAIRNVAEVEQVFVDFLHTHVWRVGAAVLLESVSHVLMATEVLVLLRAFGLQPSLYDVVVIEGSAKLVAFVFFFVPAQLGATEGGNALIFPVLALPVAAGVTVALIRRIRSLCIAGIGLAVSSTMRN